jgi:hypothetical protein
LHVTVGTLGPYGLLAVWLGISFGPSLPFPRLFGSPKKSMECESNFSDDAVTVEDDLSCDSETINLVEDYF